ncbi:hypothetical protein ERJ75_001136100 [Trypanosoma vivax]|nr:hypothetical protein ERJ75_001136100 [Trypanosoma vivax]
MAASDVDAQGGNARLGREARPHSAASEAWHRVRAERTGHRDGERRTREPRQALGVKDWLKKTAAQRTEPKAWHTTNPPRRGEPKLRWGAWLSGDSRTKVSEDSNEDLGSRKEGNIAAPHTQHWTQPERTATQPAAASATGTRGGAEAKRGLRRRWSEQRRECSTEERPKEGCEEGGNEQGS